jgi:hypothetical protein
MARDWANDTFESLEDFDPDNDFFLPLVLYGDETGTNINQWYPLELWMFTTPVLRRHARESAESWHHLGFIPSLDDAIIISDDDNEGPSPTNTKEKQQLYHVLMSVLIKEIEDTIENKPVMSVNLGGLWQKRRLHIHVGAVMGDQLSQDHLVGRKPIISGNAGRVHRVCMSLAVQASNVSNDLHTASEECRLVNHEIICQLNNLALMKLDPSVNGPAKTVNKALSIDTVPERKEHKKSVDYMRRVARLTEAILGKVYSMYPVRSAFEHVPFGVNKHGIIVATTEDLMWGSVGDVIIAGIGRGGSGVMLARVVLCHTNRELFCLCHY